MEKYVYSRFSLYLKIVFGDTRFSHCYTYPDTDQYKVYDLRDGSLLSGPTYDVFERLGEFSEQRLCYTNALKSPDRDTRYAFSTTNHRISRVFRALLNS